MQRLTGVCFVINCARLITAGRIGRLLPGMSAQLQPRPYLRSSMPANAVGRLNHEKLGEKYELCELTNRSNFAIVDRAAL